MTGKESSEMKPVVGSELAVAHLVLKVANLESSCQFYSNLGLPPFATDEGVAIIELRGGTHLLLMSADHPAGDDVAESLTGQFNKKLSEKFDLMIKGKSLNELEKYRLELISRGIAAGDIPDETSFGHHLFCIKDPDGNGITIYTSHATK
ncbi:MAG TPA: VOC family protein [Elusimicrobiota bacterium]|nr:VOC family protein [Elusimicrobiota bacterium]